MLTALLLLVNKNGKKGEEKGAAIEIAGCEGCGVEGRGRNLVERGCIYGQGKEMYCATG